MKKLLLFIPLVWITATTFAQEDLSLYRSYFDNAPQSWVASFQNFNLSDFRFTGTEAFADTDIQDIDDLQDFYRDYKALLYFNKDKTAFIDLYSHQVDAYNKGTGPAQPEQTVCLCDIAGNYWRSIYAMGADRAEGVVWIDNGHFILQGVKYDEQNRLRPVIILGDMAKQELNIYESANARCYQVADYTNKQNKLAHKWTGDQ